MNEQKKLPLKIGIIGAGFAGTSLAAHLHAMGEKPFELILVEKKTRFGVGDAYNTPYPFHLLNVCAEHMSAFEQEPDDFVSWLHENIEELKSPSVRKQFVPRLYYGDYLQHLLRRIQADQQSHVRLKLAEGEVIDLIPREQDILLILKDHSKIAVDKVVFALGNNPPVSFPFPVSNTRTIQNPWDFKAPEQIAKEDPVLIVGTGLSMIDAVLTLYHQQHQGKIYALSRHGLLPLPHQLKSPDRSIARADLPTSLNKLMQYMRHLSDEEMKQGGDWRSVVNGIRKFIPALWAESNETDKKRFIRHVAAYWNVHRHRLPVEVANLLTELSAQKQFTVLKGRVLSVDHEIAQIKLRHSNTILPLTVKWLINCMGPSLSMAKTSTLMSNMLQRQLGTFDSLNLGLMTSQTGALLDAQGRESTRYFALGPIRKATLWETSAVPEIRKQCFDLAKHLLS